MVTTSQLNFKNPPIPAFPPREKGVEHLIIQNNF
jgi:hypothetical protein